MCYNNSVIKKYLKKQENEKYSKQMYIMSVHKNMIIFIIYMKMYFVQCTKIKIRVFVWWIYQKVRKILIFSELLKNIKVLQMPLLTYFINFLQAKNQKSLVLITLNYRN